MAADNKLNGGLSEIALNEATPALRRIPVYLTLSGSPVTGKAGAAVRVSKNGASSAAGLGSLVQIDSSNLAGHYYYQCSASEVDTQGFLSISISTSGIDDFNTSVQVRPTAVASFLDLPLPTSPTPGTVGQALLAALADGFGKWVRDNDLLHMYDPEGATLLWTFRLTGPRNLPAVAREKNV